MAKLIKFQTKKKSGKKKPDTSFSFGATVRRGKKRGGGAGSGAAGGGS
jgi:hypothetical protein